MIIILAPVLLLAAFADTAPQNSLEVGKHYLQKGKQGDYQYGYNDGHAVKDETRSADGTVRGSYSYVDANHLTQNVQYRADKNGFVASSSSDLLADPNKTAPNVRTVTETDLTTAAATTTTTPESPIVLCLDQHEIPEVGKPLLKTSNAQNVDQSQAPEVGKNFLRLGNLGDYQYGYNDGHAVKDETRTADGTVHGSYQYLDANRVPQNVQYRADRNGFVLLRTPEQLNGHPATPLKAGLATETPQKTPVDLMKSFDIRSPLYQPQLPEVGTLYFQMGKHGDYQYGYNDGHTVKDELRTVDGTVHGAYRYGVGQHVTQNVQYRADRNGFVATSTNELSAVDPVPKVSGFEAPIVVPDFDLRLSPEQHKVVSKSHLPYYAVPFGYPVQPATKKGEKDDQKQSRSSEGQEQPQHQQQQQHPMIYVSFLIPYAVHPQSPVTQN